MAVYVITIMPPGKDAKNLQGTKKLSDKSSDKQQQSPPKQLVSKGGVSEPRFSQAIDQQQSHQSNQHEAVLQHQHQTFQQQIVCRTRIFNSLPQINNFTMLTIIWLAIVNFLCKLFYIDRPLDKYAKPYVICQYEQ